jgi:hypothetical protein
MLAHLTPQFDRSPLPKQVGLQSLFFSGMERTPPGRSPVHFQDTFQAKVGFSNAFASLVSGVNPTERASPFGVNCIRRTDPPERSVTFAAVAVADRAMVRPFFGS